MSKYRKPSIARLFKRTKLRLPMIGDPKAHSHTSHKWARHTEAIYDQMIAAKDSRADAE